MATAAASRRATRGSMTDPQRSRRVQVLGDDLDVAVAQVGSGGQCVSDAQVQACLGEGGDLVHQHLPHEAVGEAEPTGSVASLVEEPVDERRFQVVEGVGATPRGPQQQATVDVAADHGGDVQQLACRRREPVQSVAHDVGEARRHGGRAPGCRRTRRHPPEVA